MSLSNPDWLSKITNDTERRRAYLRQLSFLLMHVCNLSVFIFYQNILSKRFSFSFFHDFTHSRLMKCLYSSVNSTAPSIRLLRPLYIAANKESLTKRQTIFRCIELLFPPLYCLNCSFKLLNSFRSYAGKQKGCFFSEQTVYCIHGTVQKKHHVSTTALPTNTVVNCCLPADNA